MVWQIVHGVDFVEGEKDLNVRFPFLEAVMFDDEEEELNDSSVNTIQRVNNSPSPRFSFRWF